MSNKTRKHIWPVALMSLVVFGVLAAVVALSAVPQQSAEAHECETLTGSDRARCESVHNRDGVDHEDGGGGPGNGGNGGGNGPMVMPGAVDIDGFSSSPSGKADLTITIDTDMTGSLPIGSKVVLYLDDKFQVPGTISSSTVNFVSYDSPSSGSPRAASVKVDDGDSDQLGEDAWAIIATVPNMASDDNPEGIAMGDDLTLVIDEAAGIKSPTEAGTYKYGYQVVRPGGPSQDFDMVTRMDADALTVDAKVGLDDENNKRGFELTITGSGFNSGSSATAYVLKKQMTEPSCATVIADGESLGSATVASDHKAVITAEVTGGSKGDFSPGKMNYICVRDDNSPDREMSISPKPFDLQHSVAVEPTDVASGEEVTVKLRDYAADIQIEKVSLDGKKNWYRVDPVDDPETTADEGKTDDFDIKINTAVTEIMFDMPGGVSGDVEVAVVATKPDGMDDDTERDSVSDKTATITVNPSGLKLSQTEVAPNASIIISGSGFNDDSRIMVSNITLDGEPIVVSDAGTQKDDDDNRYVKVTSSGTFTATVRVWSKDGDANPALDDDEYTIKAKDNSGFEGKAKITIKEPTVSVMPETASPRDFIVISGENWPISTADDDNFVSIKVDERTRNADIDGSGRFRYEYQLRSTIAIGEEQDVEVTFTSLDDSGGDIEEETTFDVEEAALGLTPAAAAPGETISIDIKGMPPYTLVSEVRIDGHNRLGGRNVNTDREGDAMIADILIPFLDPGFYPVEVIVGSETRVAQLEVLAEATVSGVASELPAAVSDLGDNLDAIFHFNNANKAWTFYDPRPEFAELNTLTELNGGQPYWVLVKASQEEVDWNGRLVSFTCAADDCWNLEIW